jgi:hypothetical protein
MHIGGPRPHLIVQCSDMSFTLVTFPTALDAFPRTKVLSKIFSLVPFIPNLARWACQKIGLSSSVPWHYYDAWELDWQPHEIFDRLTIWTPPPDVAPQLIYALLLCYAERPLTTAMMIVLPRVLQHRWSHASRHVIAPARKCLLFVMLNSLFLLLFSISLSICGASLTLGWTRLSRPPAAPSLATCNIYAQVLVSALWDRRRSSSVVVFVTQDSRSRILRQDTVSPDIIPNASA